MDWNFEDREDPALQEVTPCVGVWIETGKKKQQDGSAAVTPCVGVWIETWTWCSILTWRPVTPCVGVWIETEKTDEKQKGKQSHTLRGCVDWNNIYKIILQKSDMSHPAWVCGLKQQLWERILHKLKSHPAWVCGLKLLQSPEHQLFLCHTLRGCVDWNWKHTVRFSTILVTPCVGVWIETAMRKKYAKKQLSHPAWVCGLKRWNTWS